MLKINNQDDCYLYNNVFSYQYGFLSSQFVPALLWMETPLLSNSNPVSTLQLHFRAINSIYLADPGDKAEKNPKPKQAERNKGGNVRSQSRENKPGQGEQAGAVQTCTSTSSLSLHVGRPLRHRATSWASEKGAASFSLLSLHCVGHPKCRLSPRAPRSWSRSWMTICHWALAVMELPSSLLCQLSIQQVLFLHLCWIYNSAPFFPTLASTCIGLWGMLTTMTDRLPVYTESKLDSKITLNSPPQQTPTPPGTTASPWRTTKQDFLI